MYLYYKKNLQKYINREVILMIELAQTLLPNLPKDLNWVYGIIYIIESIVFFGMLLSPFFFIFTIKRKKR